jgi:molybdenum ABC transporter molybdate-binding protein
MSESLFPRDWQVSVKVALERLGQTVLGENRLELLEAIDACHSISAAARRIGVSYRHAWMMVQGMNEAAGEPLVVSATGGQHGGGAQLTSLARWTVAVLRGMHAPLQETATALFHRSPGHADRASVHVAAAVCLEEVLGQLLTDFRLREPGIRVRAVFGASDELAEHVLAGAPTDLFITAGPEPLHRLEQAGIAATNRRTVLAENALAAIAPGDRRLPVHNSADLLRSEVTRIALAEPSCPLGRYTRDYLGSLYEQVRERAVYVDNSRAVGAAVRARRVDVGLVYGSDAAQPSGCRVLFKARRGPAPIQLCGALLRHGPQTEHAQTLLTFLASREAAQRFRRCGFHAPSKR